MAYQQVSLLFIVIVQVLVQIKSLLKFLSTDQWHEKADTSFLFNRNEFQLISPLYYYYDLP